MSGIGKFVIPRLQRLAAAIRCCPEHLSLQPEDDIAMVRSLPRAAAAALVLLSLGACATRTAPVEVTRFHLGQAIERGGAFIEPAPGGDAGSLEYQTYAAAVSRELARIGFPTADNIATSLFVATVDVARGERAGMTQRRSPVSIGIGGGTGGFGGGIGFGIGGGRGGGDVIVTQLSVQLKRRSDQSIVWEGRAQTEASENAPAAQPGIAAAKLAEALFQGFPGESGRTITVE
jgi:hypothetical protein